MNEVSYDFSEKSYETTNKVEENLLDYSLLLVELVHKLYFPKNLRDFVRKPLSEVIYSIGMVINLLK